MPDSLKKLVSKEVTRRLPCWTVLGSQAMFMQHNSAPTQNLQKGEIHPTNFSSFTKSVKCIFFQSIIQFPIFTVFIFVVWSTFGQKECSFSQSSHSSEWQLKGLSEAIQQELSWTEWCHENVAWLPSSVQLGATMSNFALLLRWTYCKLFISIDKTSFPQWPSQ